MTSLLFVGFLTAYSVRELENAFWAEESENYRQQMLAMMAAGVVEAVIVADRPILTTFVEQTVMQDPDIARLRVLDESGVVLVEWQHDDLVDASVLRSYSKPIIVEGETFGAIESDWSVLRFQTSVERQVRRSSLPLACFCC